MVMVGNLVIYIYTYLFIYIILLICPIRRYVIYNNIYICISYRCISYLCMYLAKPKERVSQLVPSSRCFLDHTGDNPTIYQYSRGQVEIRGSLHKENTGFWKPLFPESRKVKKKCWKSFANRTERFQPFLWGVQQRCHGMPWPPRILVLGRFMFWMGAEGAPRFI